MGQDTMLWTPTHPLKTIQTITIPSFVAIGLGVAGLFPHCNCGGESSLLIGWNNLHLINEIIYIYIYCRVALSPFITTNKKAGFHSTVRVREQPVAELERQKINIYAKEKHIIRSILK